MHYRALFKHYQRRDAAGCEVFVKPADAKPRPLAVTPTDQGAS